jgi:hypothetical protein
MPVVRVEPDKTGGRPMDHKKAIDTDFEAAMLVTFDELEVELPRPPETDVPEQVSDGFEPGGLVTFDEF